MNKLILITVLSVWVGFAAAQTTIAVSQSDPAAKATRFTQVMTVELDLTGEQRETVHCAQLTFLQAKVAIIKDFEENGGNSINPRMKLFELRKERDRKIQEALTVSQIEKYNAYQNQGQANPK